MSPRSWTPRWSPFPKSKNCLTTPTSMATCKNFWPEREKRSKLTFDVNNCFKNRTGLLATITEIFWKINESPKKNYTLRFFVWSIWQHFLLVIISRKILLFNCVIGPLVEAFKRNHGRPHYSRLLTKNNKLLLSFG